VEFRIIDAHVKMCQILRVPEEDIMSKRFDGQVVWITGGGTGIGRHCALEFARQGGIVVVSGRRLDKLQTVVAECEALGATALALACDVNSEASMQQALETIISEYGALHVVLANAGFGVSGRFEKLTIGDWRRQFETNVFGLIITAQVALPELHKTKGRLALVGSVAGFLVAPGAGAYHASKYAVRAIGQALALELHGSGVSCTTVHPGFVKSEIARVDNEGNHHPEWQDKRPQWLMWETDRAARVMVSAIYRRKNEFVFTAHGKAVAFLGRVAPGFVHFAMTRMGAGYKRR